MIIVYASRQLKLYEKTYPIHDLKITPIVKDYDIKIHQLRDKANIVADALCKKDQNIGAKITNKLTKHEDSLELNGKLVSCHLNMMYVY